MEQLKPCPFCGGEGVLVKDRTYTYWIRCRKCGVRQPYTKYNAPYEAIEAWNRRVTDVDTD